MELEAATLQNTPKCIDEQYSSLVSNYFKYSIVSILAFQIQSCHRHQIILPLIMAISTALHDSDCSPFLALYGQDHWLYFEPLVDTVGYVLDAQGSCGRHGRWL